MITLLKQDRFCKPLMFVGLKDDTKPTEYFVFKGAVLPIRNRSTFYEADTATFYIYDGDSDTWVKQSDGGEGGYPEPTGTIQITQNGTGIDVKDYAEADVAVENSYTQEDEGKVVENGSLVSQTSLSISADGTYDTTKNNEVVVSVGGGGSDVPSGYTLKENKEACDPINWRVGETSKVIFPGGTTGISVGDHIYITGISLYNDEFYSGTYAIWGEVTDVRPNRWGNLVIVSLIPAGIRLNITESYTLDVLDPDPNAADPYLRPIFGAADIRIAPLETVVELDVTTNPVVDTEISGVKLHNGGLVPNCNWAEGYFRCYNTTLSEDKYIVYGVLSGDGTNATLTPRQIYELQA